MNKETAEQMNVNDGRRIEAEMCLACRDKMKKLLSWKDVAKGAANPNHLIKIFKRELCPDCQKIIMSEALRPRT